MNKLNFELLCIDSTGSTVIRNEKNFIDRLIGNGLLWKNPEKSKATISDKELDIKLSVAIVQSNPDTSVVSFAIKIVGEDKLEDFRLNLITHLKDERFDYIYIVTDDISKEYCQELYPYLYTSENLLRKYLTLFFATKLGPKWWNDIATDELNKKVSTRKNNETVFSQRNINGKTEPLSDTKAFLIDFKDLGEIIYRVSAGNLKMEDIKQQINELNESEPEDLLKSVQELKKAIKTNIKKFFPTFESIEFQKKWEFLYTIRNKVAHNGLITLSDKNIAVKYAKEIRDFLIKENESLVKLSIEAEDKDIIEQYQTTIVKQSSKYRIISQEEIALELDKTDTWNKKNRRPFIGLRYFVVNTLGLKGYDISSSYEMITHLEQKGYIQTYQYEGGYSISGINPTAIRIVKPLAELYNQEIEVNK